MPATYLAEITDEMIRERLALVRRVGVAYCTTHQDQADLDRWQADAKAAIALMTTAEVREALANDLAGDDPASEIGMAISIAAEPDDMPDGCIIEIDFAD